MKSSQSKDGKGPVGFSLLNVGTCSGVSILVPTHPAYSHRTEEGRESSIPL
jgi:hypothetical protein